MEYLLLLISILFLKLEDSEVKEEFEGSQYSFNT